MGVVTGFVDMFDPFSVKYSTRNNMTEYGLIDIPTMPFQLGITQDPGVAYEVLDEGSGTSAARMKLLASPPASSLDAMCP